jgi:hypothetical protein
VKFADDSALLGLIENDDCSAYLDEVDKLATWCSDNNLDLNVQKTKEIVCDYRKKKQTPPLLVIRDNEVERVSEYKYLGTTIACDLSWSSHIASVVKKCHSRLFFLRKLKQFRLRPEILVLFYRASIESILTYNFVTWFSSCTVEDKNRLERIVKQAEKVTGIKLPSMDSLFVNRTRRKAGRIMKDPAHPLYGHFETLPSGRRFRAARARTQRFAKSYIPSAIRILNGDL